MGGLILPERKIELRDNRGRFHDSAKFSKIAVPLAAKACLH